MECAIAVSMLNDLEDKHISVESIEIDDDKTTITTARKEVKESLRNLYTGCMSDVEIAELSGLIDLLEQGDSIMANKAFVLNKVLEGTGIGVNTSHFLICQGQITVQKKRRYVTKLLRPTGKRRTVKHKGILCWDGYIGMIDSDLNKMVTFTMSKKCAKCEKTVYPTEELKCLDKFWHKACFKCEVCNMTLNMKNYKGYNKIPYCNVHYPKTSFTAVADTSENQRIKQNTKVQSNFEHNPCKTFQIESERIVVCGEF
uniref:LIM zinc-binding domain-containing protein n=1 Tax=Magallana gigas TaxID=29159 RepID=A0A8W8NWZ5_MAGGI